MSKQFPLAIAINAVDKATAPLRRINKQLNSMMSGPRKLNNSFKALGQEAGLNKLGKRMDVVGNRAKTLGKRFAVLSGITGYAFKTQLLDTAAEFERFGAVLETVEGSSEKAKKSMQWVSNFAAETPFEIETVTDSFVKLRSYGLDPTNGLLKTLGDTAAGMGKPINMAVEAMADAVTGENERLKEFGIKARKHGNMIVYEYSHNGDTMRKAADASNRAVIQKTLEMIWNEKYAGAMKKQMKTWNGMMSNIADQWSRFSRMIMDAGVFDFMKSKLSGVLAKLNAMAKDGSLQTLANEIGVKIVNAFKAMWRIGGLIVDLLDKFASILPETTDGMKRLQAVVVLLGAAITGPFLLSLIMLGTSLAGIGVKLAMLAYSGFPSVIASVTAVLPVIGSMIAATWSWTTALLALPITWVVAGIVALVGAGVYLYKNWNKVLKIFDGFWSKLKSIFSVLKKLKNLLPKWLQKKLGISSEVKIKEKVIRDDKRAADKGRRVTAAEVIERASLEKRQTVRTEVVLKAENLPKNTKVEVVNNDADSVDMDLGYSMAY
ncbi:MAG: hypothetical protein GY795_43065 [Desulfobacterales bacterium]|nr:hypothetical protein [Desulfobacterales bacterium]